MFGLFQASCGHQPEFLGGRSAKSPPRIRLSCYASSTLGTTYADPERLGLHGYKHRGSEKNGILYTCKAGHIDIAHLRKAADWTAYLARKARANLMKDNKEFSFGLYEPSRYFVHITYPQGWAYLPETEKQEIAREVSIGLGQYFAFIGCTWHEIVTWFGYRPIGIYPEFPSSFSWEDSFSNLLGTHIAARALWDAEYKYDEAMTLGLYRELQRLGVRPKSTAVLAADKVKGQWYSGGFLFLVDIKGRNLDIGLDDGFITPWIVESLPECEGAQAKPYPVPNLHFLAEYGFSARLEIEPREMQKGKILKIVYPDPRNRKNRIEPAVHFAPIMDYIREDALKRYGPDVRSNEGAEQAAFVPGARQQG